MSGLFSPPFFSLETPTTSFYFSPPPFLIPDFSPPFFTPPLADSKDRRAWDMFLFLFFPPFPPRGNQAGEPEHGSAPLSLQGYNRIRRPASGSAAFPDYFPPPGPFPLYLGENADPAFFPFPLQKKVEEMECIRRVFSHYLFFLAMSRLDNGSPHLFLSSFSFPFLSTGREESYFLALP